MPRVFVYHAAEEIGSPTAETFKAMERRLLRAITNPAMIAVFVFGTLLLLTPAVLTRIPQPWRSKTRCCRRSRSVPIDFRPSGMTAFSLSAMR
jgi:uncharacterized membrane protein